jgi:hypothetical protein
MKRSLPASVYQALQASGCLPSKIPISCPRVEWGQNLLPWCAKVWRENRNGSRTDPPGPLAELESHEAALTWGIAGENASRWQRWLGDRLLWWPRGIPLGKRVALVSSRLGRRLDARKSWFRALRSACRQIDRRNEVLVSAENTSVARILPRAAKLFRLRLIELSPCRADETLADWLARCWKAHGRPAANGLFPASFSPAFDVGEEPGTRIACTSAIPERDRAVAGFSDDLLALMLRPKGNLHRLMRIRLKEAADDIRIAIGPELTPEALVQELVAEGALPWRPSESEASNRRASAPARGATGATIIALNSVPETGLLTHWTRACPGPWPDESEEAYLDQLILHSDTIDRSAEAALHRIVRQQRILGTARTIRGGWRMVSFTAVPLTELPHKRVFRSHRGRWDFEFYGICIRQDWLREHGGRPVHYGEDADWMTLPESERPYFQQRYTRGTNQAPAIDWSCEREWRVAGDVDLAELPPEDGILFVPTLAEAERLVAVSRWPVVVLTPPGD